jgi:hypothetical protein
MKGIFCLLLIGSLFAEDSSHLAIRVISAGEGWSMDGRPLTRNNALPAISSITGRPHADGLILECGKKGWLAYQCGNTDCRIPVCASKGSSYSVQRVDGAAKGQNADHSQDSMLLSFFNREPRDVVTLGVRAAGIADDGVVLEDAEGVHLAPVLDSVLDGRYCFCVGALPADQGEDLALQIVWRHSEAASGTTKNPGLIQGLYTIREGAIGSDGACIRDADAQPAWVLVTAAADFARIERNWKQASSRLNRLAAKPRVDPIVVSTVRRILLAYLADHLGSR